MKVLRRVQRAVLFMNAFIHCKHMQQTCNKHRSMRENSYLFLTSNQSLFQKYEIVVLMIHDLQWKALLL